VKVAALLVALAMAFALSADVGQRVKDISSSCESDDLCTTPVVAAPASEVTAIRHHHVSAPTSRPHDANGNRVMVTVKTAYGFNITVHPAYASKFQKFFALLKDRGYKVPANITRCWAPQGTHVPGSNHYIGAACDIQTGWNRGPAFVHHISDIVKQAGLYDGCAFHDCGHIEAVRGTHNRAPNLYASLEKFRLEQATENYQP
jgi:hypothetical protein